MQETASCFNPDTQKLFFAAWGYPGHYWQHLLDTSTHELTNITTDPPTLNAHGCFYNQDSFLVATDGGDGQYASVVKINGSTLRAETLINNFYQQPFLGFNDLMRSRYDAQTTPAVYFINTTDLTSRWVFQTDGNANGMAIAADGTLYVDITGISSGRLNAKDPFKTRALLSFDTGNSSPPLQHERLFYNSISYYCDGVRVSKSGLVFCAARDGVEIIDPKEGLTLGRVRTGGGENAAVNIALDDHTLWIVGKGGVWKVSRIQELLSRDW